MKSHFRFLFTWILGLLLIAGGGTALAQAQITNFEVNQVLGVQKDNHKYFVAGKSTVVRATLSEATAIDPSRTVVKAFRNGKAAFDISPKKTPGPVSTVDFLCDNLKACGSWAAGTYTFQVYINGTGAEVIESFPFVAGTSVRILAVAVKANYGTKGI